MVRRESAGVEKRISVAILPTENLSGAYAPLKELREELKDKVQQRGFGVLDDGVLERFMAKHRMRYSGGINKELAKAIKEDTGVDSVLVSSLDLFSQYGTPKVAFTARMISAGETPEILWMDSIGMAGDDAPGFLGLGEIIDRRLLLAKAAEAMADSLARYHPGEKPGKAEGVDSAPQGGEDQLNNDLDWKRERFRPKRVFRAPAIFAGGNKKIVVAVVPFVNESSRKNAGELMALHFLNRLKREGKIEVVELGVVRQELLKLRIVMEDGLSIPQADLLFSMLDIDLIVGGEVIEYKDSTGSWGKPRVDFSTYVLERKTKQLVWASKSQNWGDDWVVFFDSGRVTTAHALASGMVREVVERLIGNG